MENGNRKLLLGFVMLAIVIFLGLIYLAVVLEDTSAPEPQVQLEILEDIFVDIDGDGDLDYVHSVQFVRQEDRRVDLNPTPAPIQPGQ